MGDHEAAPDKGQRLSETNNIPTIGKGTFLIINSSLGKTQDGKKVNERSKTNKHSAQPERKSQPNKALFLKSP